MSGAINNILQVLLLGENMRAKFAFKRMFLFSISQHVSFSVSENLLVNSFVKKDSFLSFYFFNLNKRERYEVISKDLQTLSVSYRYLFFWFVLERMQASSGAPYHSRLSVWGLAEDWGKSWQQL